MDGKWQKLKIIEEVFKVKGKPDMIEKIKITHRGPLVEAE